MFQTATISIYWFWEHFVDVPYCIRILKLLIVHVFYFFCRKLRCVVCHNSQWYASVPQKILKWFCHFSFYKTLIKELPNFLAILFVELVKAVLMVYDMMSRTLLGQQHKLNYYAYVLGVVFLVIHICSSFVNHTLENSAKVLDKNLIVSTFNKVPRRKRVTLFLP